MRRLLNTLYVTTQGSYLHRDGETVTVSQDNTVVMKIPIHTLQGVVCFGRVSMSPFLMGLCAERSVGVSFLSRNGRFLARVNGPVSGNVLLRREQYRRADDEQLSCEIARAIVIAKLNNCRVILLRAVREHPQEEHAEKLADAADHLLQNLKELELCDTLDSMRGLEGEAARSYFAVFDHLILAQKEDFVFHERSRRPPLDKVNALLSFIYTLLVHDVTSALECVGLDPAVGLLHRDRPGRPGLALDMMEEFRPYLADRLVLSLINRKQVGSKGFTRTETGAVMMDDETRKEVLVAYQTRKQEEITHPFLKEKMQVGMLPHVQALLMARYMRGDLDGYPPFLWR